MAKKKQEKAELKDCSKCKESYMHNGDLICGLKIQDESRLNDGNYSASIVTWCDCYWFRQRASDV